MNMTMKFPNNVQSIREKTGLKAIAVADACGISKGTMSKIENGGRRMYPEELIAIANELNCPPFALIPDNLRPKNIKPSIEPHKAHIEGAGSLISLVETYYPRLDTNQQIAAKGAIIALLNGPEKKAMGQ